MPLSLLSSDPCDPRSCPSYQLVSSLKSVSSLAGCSSFETSAGCAAPPAPACINPVYNQGHHHGINTLIANNMNTFLESAENDLKDESVRSHVSSHASLYEACGNEHTTDNNRRTESTKLDRPRILSTLEQGVFNKRPFNAAPRKSYSSSRSQANRLLHLWIRFRTSRTLPNARKRSGRNNIQIAGTILWKDGRRRCTGQSISLG